MVLDNAEAIEKFEAEYTTLKTHSRRLPSVECCSPRDAETGNSANYARDMNGIPRIQ